ncbi:MAG: hypothetical protein GTO02_20155 [Candidatus Dadabacteria bacterium]|nr:hypothetical protein [Candidatus Dadabacteria bacterium]NIQ16611.1 hypothetical protein [Candidatus Dadabacteria bacterium]
MIIGEKLGRAETLEFISEIADDFTKDGNCLKIALELPSDQQNKIDKSKGDQSLLNMLEINGVYDREHYIKLIGNFNKLIADGRCLKIYAVGPPRTVPVESSVWIKKETVKIVDSNPTLLIVELKNALKYFKWDSSGRGAPYLAERLRINGYSVASLLNYWKETGCMKDKVNTVSSKSLIADWYVNELIYSEVEYLPKRASSITDGVNIWRCDSPSKKVEIVVDEKEIKNAIRQNRPIVGMNKDQVIKAIGKPSKKNELTGETEKWEFECSHEDGFDFHCFTVTFENNKAVNVKEL